MSHKSLLALLSLGGLMLSVPAAQAQNVFSFSFSGSARSPQFVDPTLTAGVVPAKNFNTDNGGNNGTVSSGNALNDGSSSNISLTYNAYDAQSGSLAKNAGYSSDGNQQLLNGFIESGPPMAPQANATVTVSNILFPSYSLYVYSYNGALSNANTMGTFTVTPTGSVTGVSQTVKLQNTFSPSTPFTMASGTTAGDYLVFTGLTGSSFNLTANRVTGDAMSTTFIPIDGFQIVANSSPVPETSTTVSFGLLLGLGLAGMFTARRRAAGKRASK